MLGMLKVQYPAPRCGTAPPHTRMTLVVMSLLLNSSCVHGSSVAVAVVGFSQSEANRTCGCLSDEGHKQQHAIGSRAQWANAALIVPNAADCCASKKHNSESKPCDKGNGALRGAALLKQAQLGPVHDGAIEARRPGPSTRSCAHAANRRCEAPQRSRPHSCCAQAPPVWRSAPVGSYLFTVLALFFGHDSEIGEASGAHPRHPLGRSARCALPASAPMADRWTE